MVLGGFQVTRRGILSVSFSIAMCIGACLLVFGQNIQDLDRGSDEYDLDLLEAWNRRAAYDSIAMYLIPKYKIWSEENPANIAQTIKYYVNYLQTKQGIQLIDTLDKYENLVRAKQGEALTLQFFNLQRAYQWLQTGKWDEAKELGEQMAGLTILQEAYPRLAADAMGFASFMAMYYGELEKAIDYNQRADELLIDSFGETFYGRILTLNNFSILYEQIGEHKKGLEYTEQTLRIVKEHYSEAHENHFKVLNALGLKYQTLGQVNDAIKIFEEAIQLNKDHDKDVNLFDLYMNLSSAYVTKWDYENGEKYLALAEANLADMSGDFARFELEINLRRASMLNDIYREDEAQPYLDRIAEIIADNFTGEEFFLSKIYALFYTFDMSSKDYESARKHIEKYLSIQEKHLGQNTVEWANGIAWKGELFQATMDFDSAHHYMDIALEYYLQALGDKHHYYIELYLQKVETYISQQKLDEADSVLNKILMLDIPEAERSTEFLLPDYEALFKHTHLIKVLQHKIEIVEKGGDAYSLQNLRLKGVIYDYLAKEFDRVIAMYGGFKTRDDLFVGSERIFKKAIANAYLLYNLTKDEVWVEVAFQYAERTRSLQFQEIMRDKLAKLEAGIPDSLRVEELSLWTQKNKLQDQLLATSREDSLIYATLSKNLLQATVEYEQFIKRLETEYPKYYDLKYNIALADIKSVKKHLLNKKKALIQYSIIDSFAYIHVISRKSVHFVRLSLPGNIDSKVNDYYHFMQSREFSKIQELGSQLHRDIFEPLMPLLDHVEELIVVPDSWLYYVNLESLPLNLPRTPFLLNLFQIQYCYSPTVAVQIKMQPKQKNATYDWIGFVPGFEVNGFELNDRSFAHQPWAVALADSVASQFNSKLFAGEDANKDAFSANAGLGQILHVGTHAVANDQDPLNSYMVLGGENGHYEQITAADIFNKRINSACTVLTACETAVGQIKGGEGMVSLARSFSYAGSPNLVVTLWSVDDQQTARIIRSFYDYIAKGYTFDRSLRMAKLDYLSTARGELKHPFYWAGILYYGMDDQLYDNVWTRNSILLYSLVFAGVLVVSMFIWRRARR